MVTMKIRTRDYQSNQKHVAGTTAERLVVSLMAKDKEKEGEKSKKKLQKVRSRVSKSLILC
jgi:hypothetical protein